MKFICLCRVTVRTIFVCLRIGNVILTDELQVSLFLHWGPNSVFPSTLMNWMALHWHKWKGKSSVGVHFMINKNNFLQSWIFQVGQNQLRWNVVLLEVHLQDPMQSLNSFSFLGNLTSCQNIYMNCILLSGNRTLIHILWTSSLGDILYFQKVLSIFSATQ